MTETLVFTVDEAAKLIGIGRSAAYGAIASGELPSLRIGRSIRIPKSVLDNLLAKNNLSGVLGQKEKIYELGEIISKLKAENMALKRTIQKIRKAIRESGPSDPSNP